MRVEVARDFPASGQPNLVMARDVRQGLFKGRHPIGLTNQIGVKWYAHHRSRFFALSIEPVKLAFEDVCVATR